MYNIYLTQYQVDKCGGIEAIQNWYKKCGIIVEVIIIPDTYKGRESND